MKKYLKTKHKIELAVAIIGVVGCIIVAFIQSRDRTEIEDNSNEQEETLQKNYSEEDNNTQIDGTIEGETINIINGNGNQINSYSTINNNTNIMELDYEFADKTIEQLLMMANNACINEQYDYAFDIYSRPELGDSKVAMINLGYIYENGLSYVGIDYEKAKECYEKSDCIEGKRNLLSLQFKADKDVKAICDLMVDLLWVENDQITWDYVAKCLFDETWDEYATANEVNKQEFTFNLSDLYEWEYTNHFAQGYRDDVPEDTIVSRWVLQGLDYAEGEGYSYPYATYRLQIIKFYKNIDILDGMYYLYKSELYSVGKGNE